MEKRLTSGQTSESLFIAGRERLFILFIVIATVLMICSQPAKAQPHFEWVRNYPITGRAVAIDSSGYVYFVGEQTDGTQKILKYDSLGILLWTNDFNVITGSNYLGIAAYKSKYLYITYSNQNHSFGLSKFDTSGTLLWTRSISGYYYEPYCMTLDMSGNIYVAGEIGYYASNSFTVKYTPAGDTLWSAIYYPSINGGSYLARSISVDNQKNVYITGGEIYQSIWSYTTIKYDSLGNRKWVSKYYSPYSSYSTAGGGSVKADNKGNCYVTGYITYAIVNGFAKYTPATIKYGSNGDSIWTRLFLLPDTIDFSRANDLVFDENDNVFVPCNYTIKYDKNGNQLWYVNNNQYMTKAVMFENNIYVSGGWGGLLEISRIIGYNQYNGSQIFNQQYTTYVYPTSFMTFGRALYSAISANDSAILIKYSSNTSFISGNGYTIDNFKLHQNYPNPFNPSTNIKYQISKYSFVSLKVYDILGKEIASLVNEKKTHGSHKVQFNANDLPSGVYYYSLFIDGIKSDTKKMVIVR